MNENQSQLHRDAFKKAQGSAAMRKLLASEDTKRMMQLLEQQGGVQEAARSAAGGDPSRIMEMMKTLMSSEEGARLVERLSGQAERSGL